MTKSIERIVVAMVFSWVATSITAQDIDITDKDSIIVEIGEVTVSATTRKLDKKMVFPTERQVKSSTNGIDMLHQLMLPRLQVDMVTNEVSVAGGGEVQLRINGARVEKNDILALQPTDIIRIEFHDNPGLRYGDAEIVLDYIVRHHRSGGNVGVSIHNSFRLKQYGENDINARIHHKRSEFALTSFEGHRDMHELWRDNVEIITFPDGHQLRREENGTPDNWKMFYYGADLSYSYQDERQMFSGVFRYFNRNEPDLNAHGKILTSVDTINMIDNQTYRLLRPALDLYYQRRLAGDQTVVFNLVGTRNYTHTSRFYQEFTGIDAGQQHEMLADINNAVTGDKYSWIGEGIYEKKFANHRLSAGLRHSQSFSDNFYQDAQTYSTDMRQNVSSIYLEWRFKLSKWDMSLGAGVTRSDFRHESGEHEESYTFNPRLTVFRPVGKYGSLRIRSLVVNNTPSLANLSAVEQTIDTIQVQRGNPSLKPYIGSRSAAMYEFKKDIVYFYLQGEYRYAHRPVMAEKFWEGGKIVQTWDNQRNAQGMRVAGMVRIGPFLHDIFQFSVFGGVIRYIMNGNHYRHVYNNPFVTVDLSATYKNFTLAAKWLPLPSNTLDGETMNGGETQQAVTLTYRLKNLSFGAGMFYPFAKEFKRNIENWSAVASSYKRLYINDLTHLVFFKMSYNFSFGQKFESREKRLNNSDEDSGIMKAGK